MALRDGVLCAVTYRCTRCVEVVLRQPKSACSPGRVGHLCSAPMVESFLQAKDMPHEFSEDWKPLEVATRKDPRKAFDRMREQCPVAHSNFLGWSVFRHEDIAAALADPETFINVSKFPAIIPNGLNPPGTAAGTTHSPHSLARSRRPGWRHAFGNAQASGSNLRTSVVKQSLWRR